MKKKIFVYLICVVTFFTIICSVIFDLKKDNKIDTGSNQKIVLADTTLTSRIYMT